MKNSLEVTVRLIKAHNYLSESIDYIKGCEDSQEILKLAQLAEQAADKLLVNFRNATTIST